MSDKTKENMKYFYKKRTISDMLNGETDIVQDFKEHDQALADGKISYKEWSEGFSKARHPIPCCIGGSSVGTLFGHNKYKTPRELQLQIAFPFDEQFQEKTSDETEITFARGHFAESYVINFGAFLLEKELVSKGLAEKVEVFPYTQQCRNMAFPNCIGDFDSAIRITGGPYEGWWIGEGKTATYNGPNRPGYWRDYISREELSDVERVPPMYLDQVDFYLGINTFMRGAILFASCGFAEVDNIHLMIPRDDERSLLVMNTAQEFCEKTLAGITVTDEVVTEPHLLKKALKITHGKMDKSLPAKDLSEDPYMQQLVEVNAELRKEKSLIRKDLKNKDQMIEEIEAEFIKNNEGALARIEFLEKQRDLIKYRLVPAIGDGTVAEATIDDAHVQIKITSEPSFNKKTKSAIKKKHPEVWDEIVNYDPYYTVEVKTTKIEEEIDDEEKVDPTTLFG